MLIVNEEEFALEKIKLGLDELPELDIEERIGEVIPIQRGRGAIKKISDEKRVEIAIDALTSSAKDVAERHNVSLSSVAAYKHGSTSCATYNEPQIELTAGINKAKEEISDSARLALRIALNSITPEAVNKAKIKDIAGIAKDMSIVMKNMEPQQAQVNQTTKVLVYQPKLRDEEEFEVITVNE